MSRLRKPVYSKGNSPRKIAIAVTIAIVAASVLYAVSLETFKVESFQIDSINSDVFAENKQTTLEQTNDFFEEFLASQNSSITSGTFSVDKTTYTIGQTVFFAGFDIPIQDSGKIIFERPDGREYHVMDYDGIKSKTYKFYFSPSLDDEPDCASCILGKWTVSLEPNKGTQYNPIHFEVRE